MRANGFRRLPVVSGAGELVGVLTLDDAIDALSAQLASLATVTRRQPAEERRRRR
jgi:CBS domain-containing protein